MSGMDEQMPKLTDGRIGTIAKAEPPATGKRFIFDEHRDAPRGFCLKVTAAGGKSFVLQYSVDGRQRRKVIGDWPAWGLEQARIEAARLVQGIQTGNDPLEEKRKRKAEPLVREVAADWLDKHATGLRSAGTIKALMMNDLVPAIGGLKITDVRRRDIIDLVEAKAKTAPRSAAQLLIYARKLLTYAADREYISANPAADLRPASIHVVGKRDPLRQVARSRILDQDEIRQFWENVEAVGFHLLTSLALKLVLVTGQRPGEVAGMHRDEIVGDVWTIPASRRGKTETAHSVYLTKTAKEIIAKAQQELERLRQRRVVPASGHMFEAWPGKPINSTGLARAVDRASDALGAKSIPGLGRWTPHDLRRTMRTGLSQCGVRPDIAELTIGHTKRGITAVYDLHGFDADRKMALEAWERRLTTIIAGQDPDALADNVIKLEARG